MKNNLTGMAHGAVKQKWTWITLGLAAGLGLLGSFYWPSLSELVRGKEAFSKEERPREHWIRQLKQQDPAFREEAVYHLGATDVLTEDALSGIKEALRDENLGVRHMAAHVLGKFAAGDKSLIPLLVESSRDSGRLVRMESFKVLGHHGSGIPGVVEALIAGLEDPDWYVRLGVIHALSRLGSEAEPARGGLQKIAQADMSWLSEGAEKALKEINAALALTPKTGVASPSP